jgi:hypothetical protein
VSRTTFHEAGHVAAALACGRRVKVASVDPLSGESGRVGLEPPGDVTAAWELEAHLVILHAGSLAEAKAPASAALPRELGDDSWPMTIDELLALGVMVDQMCAQDLNDDTCDRSATSDDTKIEHAEDVAGREVAERARAKAAAIIDAAHADGTLALLASELESSSYLDGDDVARILHGRSGSPLKPGQSAPRSPQRERN